MCPKRRILRAVVGLVVALAVLGAGGRRARPPKQPAKGPGGKDYAHGEVRETEVGKHSTKAWIFEPADPAPEKAPVVVFLHGWAVWWPEPYEKWIRHLVRRGNIVIYPKYQRSLVTLPTRMTDNAIEGVRNALKELHKPGHVRPDEIKFAVAGHSLGAVLAANIAVTADENDLPQPLAVMCVQPGDPKHAGAVGDALDEVDLEVKSIIEDCSAIPKGTLMLVLVGDRDTIAGDITAKIIWEQIRHLPAADRDYVTMVTDTHSRRRGLVADHSCPLAPAFFSVGRVKAKTDALDYYGTWKLLDGLLDAAFYGRNRHYALGDTPEQRCMGEWSDGTPVKKLDILDEEE